MAKKKAIDISALVHEYREARKAEAAAKEAAEAIGEQLKSLLPEGKTPVVCGGQSFTVTIHTVNSMRVSARKVKEAFPETWESLYGEPSTTVRLTVN